jgi:uncharacterized membrane protein YdcZ (DUF606 family)
MTRSSRCQRRLDRVDAAHHDAITGTPGSFDTLTQALDHARTFGRPEIRLRTLALHQDALDLDALIGGFKPLFKSLDPEKVNNIATSLVTVFQGQGGTISDILSQTAQLTSTLADRDQAIGEVITNLNTVLGTVVKHQKEFDSTVVNFETLITGLKNRADPLAGAIADISDASGTLAGLLVIGAGMRGPGFGALAGVPGWAFFGGVIGVAAMALMNRAIPQIGVANAITLSVAAQLVASVLCEHFGWLGTERSPAGMTRWIGVALLVVGAALVQRR